MSTSSIDLHGVTSVKVGPLETRRVSESHEFQVRTIIITNSDGSSCWLSLYGNAEIIIEEGTHE